MAKRKPSPPALAFPSTDKPAPPKAKPPTYCARCGSPTVDVPPGGVCPPCDEVIKAEAMGKPVKGPKVTVRRPVPAPEGGHYPGPTGDGITKAEVARIMRTAAAKRGVKDATRVNRDM